MQFFAHPGITRLDRLARINGLEQRLLNLDNQIQTLAAEIAECKAQMKRYGQSISALSKYIEANQVRATRKTLESCQKDINSYLVLSTRVHGEMNDKIATKLELENTRNAIRDQLAHERGVLDVDQQPYAQMVI